MRCSYKTEVRMFFRLFFFITSCFFLNSQLIAVDQELERAPREDISGGIASCNPCVTDLETIAQELCLIRSELTACAPIPLSQADMPATLSLDNRAYCVTEELTGNITINANDVTINLDDHTVNGHIIINGQRAIIRGGKVVAPAPIDNTEADSGVIDIATSASNTQILDVYISAQDGTVAGVRGARGIDFAAAPDILIHNCVVEAGNGGPVNGVSAGGIGVNGGGSGFILENSEVKGGNGSDSTDGTITTGSGGRGIDNNGGALYTVISSTIQGGNAGNMNATNDVGNVVLGDGGSNRIDALLYTIQDSTIIGGSGGSVVTTASIGVGGPVTGGAAPRAIQTITGNITTGLISNARIFGGTTVSFSGVNIGVSGSVTQGFADATLVINRNRVLIENSVIRGANGGSITATGVIGAGATVTTSSGSTTFFMSDNRGEAAINNSRIVGGNSTTLLATGIATLSNVIHNGGGSAVVNNNGGKISIDASTLIGGSVPTITMASGNVGSAATSLTMGNGGQALNNNSSASLVSIEHSTLIGGDAAGLTTPGIVNNIIAGRGGFGASIIHNASATNIPHLVISRCQIIGGKTGDISGSTIASLAAVSASSGGNGLNIATANSGFTTLLDSTITTFRGGDITGAAGGLARNGGDGGIGINLSGAGILDVIMSRNSILTTGRGGNVTAGAAGAGGDGGTGIFVLDTVTSAELSNNTIAYTGAAGTGLVSGIAGMAIDNNAAGTVLIGNFAHHIANAVNFDLGPGVGYIESPTTTGTAFVFAANPYGNVHQP